MAISEKEKMEIIEEYKKQEETEALDRRCKVKPLHDARVHYEKVLKEKGLDWKTNPGYYKVSFYRDINESIWKAIRASVCEKYFLGKITDLRGDEYKEANEYAISLIDDLFGKISS